MSLRSIRCRPRGVGCPPTLPWFPRESKPTSTRPGHTPQSELISPSTSAQRRFRPGPCTHPVPAGSLPLLCAGTPSGEAPGTRLRGAFCL